MTHPKILLRQASATIFAALLPCLGGHAQERCQAFNLETLPKREVRAVWLTTLSNLDWPKGYATTQEGIERQKRQLTEILDRYAEANINTVLFQARVRATTTYPSALEPWDRCLTGQEGRAPGYDPLRFAIEECHKRGMELHAWLATIPCGPWTSLGCRRLRAKGLRLRKLDGAGYLDPSDERVAPYLASVCAELTEKYDIDGIHLDYIRYPDGWPRATRRNGDTPDNRRANINRIVRAIHEAVEMRKPWVKVSASPLGKYSDLTRYSSHGYNARDKVYQDAQLWLKQGWMEQLYPMQYYRGNHYFPFVPDWVANSHGRTLASGLGTWFLDPREGRWTLADISRQMEVSRWAGMGHAHFRSKFLIENHKGIYDFEQRFNLFPALVPAMKGKRDARLAPPTDLRLDSGLISWQGDAPYYNIYVSDHWPVDTDNPANLLLARFAHKQIATALAPRLFRGWPFVAVTAMDRYGNESQPLQYQPPVATTYQPQLPKNLYLANDGQQLDLSEALRPLLPMDIDRYAVATLQGVFLRSYLRPLPATGPAQRIDISSLADGVYWVYAHNKRTKKMVRVGSFEIDRQQVGFVR